MDELDFPDYVSMLPKSQHIIHSTVTKIEKIDPITGDIIEVKKTQFFYLIFQDSNLKITKIEHGNSYDDLWREGIEKAKEYGGFWTILDIHSRFIDGNVVSK